MRTIVIGCASLLVIGLAGCGRKTTEPGNIPGGAETGMLRVMLGSESMAGQIDPRVDEVWVRIDSVEARHETEGWVSVSSERQDFDLLADLDLGDGGADDGGADDGGAGGGPGGGAGGGPGYVGGPADEGGGVDEGGLGGAAGYELIGEGEVWTGGYDRLHLGIADTWIVVDGAQMDLEFIGDIDPLDPFESGLTIREPFFVDQDSVTTVRVTWNVGQNLEERENGNWFLGTDTRLEVDIAAPSGGDAGPNM